MNFIYKLKKSKKIKKFLYYSIVFLCFFYIFSVPSFGESVTLLRYSIYISMALLGIVALFYCLLYKRVRFVKESLFIPLFVAWSFIGTALYSHEFRSWLSLFLLMLSFGVFLLSFIILGNKNLILGLVSIAFFCFSIYYIIHYRNEIIDFKSYGKEDFRLGTYFDNQNGVGTFSTIGFSSSLYLTLFYKKKSRFFFIVPCFSTFLVGITTGSRTFILTTFIFVLFFLFFKFKKHKWIYLIVVASVIGVGIVLLTMPFMITMRERLIKGLLTIFGVANKVDTSTIERSLWLDYGFYLGAKRIIFGYGVDGFAIVSGVGTYSHSNYSELFCNFGLVGFAFFYSPLILLLIKTIVSKKSDKAFVFAFVVYFLIVSFASIFYYKKIYYLILAFLFYLVYFENTFLKKEQLLCNVQKVCFTCDAMSSGGAERVLANLANEMAKRGIEVTVIGVSDRSSNGSFYKLEENVEYITLHNSEKKINPLKRIVLLRKTIQTINPDIVISFLPHINVYTYFSLIGTKIPYIVSERNNPYIDPKEKIIRVLKKLSFNKANGCVFQTNDAMNYYGDKVKEKSVIIQNPLSISFVPQNNIVKRNNTVLAVGRLTIQKNYYLLLDSFKEFNERKNYAYILRIYGDGFLKNELIDYCEKLGISNKVVFAGNDNNWQEKEYMDAMYVLTSDYEGMPNSLIEAMAIGIPCISTDCPSGGPRELIRDGENGYLIEVGNKDALVEKMILISNTNPQFGEVNKNMINDLSSSKITDEWISYIMSLDKAVYE